MSKADDFAHAFRAICESHGQSSVALFYQDPDSNAHRLVVGPGATPDFLRDAVKGLDAKLKQREAIHNATPPPKADPS